MEIFQDSTALLLQQEGTVISDRASVCTQNYLIYNIVFTVQLNLTKLSAGQRPTLTY